MQRIGIVNYGMGNVGSIQRRLTDFETSVKIISTTNDFSTIDKLIFPGVGNFQKAIQNIQQLNFFTIINEMVLIKKTPILGICLGMQLMATKSEEGNADGFGWINGDVKRFNVTDKIKYKIPHTGWNTINILRKDKLLNYISDEDEFYYSNAYHFVTNDLNIISGTSFYEYDFPASIEKENVFGVQFHPEKSHDAGKKILKAFVEL